MERCGVGLVRFGVFVAIGALMGLLAGCHRPEQTTLTLSVAASLSESITEIESAYKQTHAHVDFRENFGPSGTLAGQIEQGAPVEVFLSAASQPMNALEAKGLIAAGSRRNLLRNSLVLVAPRASQLRDFQGLASSSVRVIALGDPASVPAGQYGKETLLSMQLLDKVKTKLVLGTDVRQVLTYVETGNADAGLVYATDAQTSDKVRIVATAPDSTHAPIVYPVAVVKGRPAEEAARKFVEYLGMPTAQAIFQKHGFTMAAQ